jgi:hypothetical protein
MTLGIYKGNGEASANGTTADDAELIAGVKADLTVADESEMAKFIRYHAAGQKLAILRERHAGSWEAWVRGHLGFGPRHARRFIEYNKIPIGRITSDLKTARQLWNRTNGNGSRKNKAAKGKDKPRPPADGWRVVSFLAPPRLVEKMDHLSLSCGWTPEDLVEVIEEALDPLYLNEIACG